MRLSLSPANRHAGFSLVEIVMAMGIVSFAFLSILGLVPLGMSNFRSSIDASISAQIDQQVISQAQETDFNSLPLLSGSVFFYDVDGHQLSGQAGSIYQARAWVSQAATLPGAQSANSNISTVTVQIANNPGNQSLTPDPGTHLWKAQSGIMMRTFSTLVSGYYTATSTNGS